MHHSGQDPLGHDSPTDYLPSIIEKTDQVMVFNTALSSILGIETSRPVIPSVDQQPVGFNIVDRTVLAIGVRVETVARVRRNQLKRKTCGQR